MSWRDLERASFDGIEFDVAEVTDSLGRRLARHNFPWRDGADLDDMGAKEREVSLRAIFFGNDYLINLDLITRAHFSGETAVFVHPVFGEFDAKIESMSITHSVDASNYAEVDIAIVQDGIDVFLPELQESKEALKDEIETLAGEIGIEATLLELSKSTSFVDDIGNFIDGITDFVGDIDRQINSLRDRAKTAIAEAREKYGINDIQTLLEKVNAATYAVQKLGNRLIKENPIALIEDVAITMPLVAVAHKIHGNFERFTELLDLNTIRNPFLVPKGTKLRTYAD